MIMFSLFVIRTKNRQNFKIICRKRHTKHDTLSCSTTQTKVQGTIHLCFPITEQIHHEVLSLPMSPVLSIDEVDFIIKLLISIKNLKMNLARYNDKSKEIT
jgi:dTDP-4-amino-4,6-dideoxygalactose transaminase